MANPMAEIFDPSVRRGRRAIDDGAPIDSMPWWVKAIGFVGVPSVIALGLVYALVTSIAPLMINNNKMLTDHMLQMSTMVAEQQQIRGQNERIIKVLTSSCVNGAKTQDERNRCIQ